MSKTKLNEKTLSKKELQSKLLEQLLEDYKDPKEILGENGLLKQMTKKLVEKALEKELTNHLGYSKKSTKGNNSGNSRNGYSDKTIKGDFGEVQIQVPRDRTSNFNPQIIEKGQRRFTGFDDKIISMYSRGMSTREIENHIKDIYGVNISAELVSNVTAGVLDEVKEWQNRILEPIYPIVYLDALVIKVKDEGHVRNKSVYLVMGVNIDGHKELLGMWIEKTEGAKFWLKVITDLKNRGVEDIYIACVDGLKGFPEAINSIFPQTEVQLCIVHMIRNSLKYVSYKDRKNIASDLKMIYKAPTEEKAFYELENFSKVWDNKYPTISQMWFSNWEKINPYFSYPEDIRRAIYTTNAIESLNMSLRKILKIRGSFPNDDAAFKLLYLGIKNVSKKWTMPIPDWGKAINQFAILFRERVPLWNSSTKNDAMIKIVK